MKYVLDASVGFKWAVSETDSDKANRLRDDFRNAVHVLLAPDVLPGEVGPALTRAERQGKIPVGDAVILLNDVLQTCSVLHASYPLLLRACEISSQTRVGFFDCLYVALAERENCQLVTADTRLVNAIQLPFPFVIALSS